uniref:DUF7079 family protein n=1 Tax=Psychrobacter jeotgali TaxID=179010 RepID=UPI00191B334D|nr:hypothetical protein [Psychrobacter jeotgali]
MALSDLFVDNKIDHECIAKRVAHLTINEVEQILFCEVAPVCMSNLLAPTPSVWQEFHEDYVIPEVQQHLQKMQSDWFYNRKISLKIKFYKAFLHQDWLKLVIQIRQIQKRSADDL